MMKKLLGAGVLALASVTAFTSALDFSFGTFGPQDPIGQKFAEVNFFSAGNNYAGAFFWLPTQQILPAASLTLGGDSRTCTKQIRGLYFSNAWGARLWPLDLSSYSGLLAIDPSYSGLSLAGGLYTSCTTTGTLNTGSLDLYSLYGQLTYTWRGQDMTLSMGRRYDVDNNAVYSGGPLVSSIQYFNNQTPLGYFYDNVAGIGFVGGSLPTLAHTGIVNALNNGGFINTVFTFVNGSNSAVKATTSAGTFNLNGGIQAGLDTLWRIAVLGNVLLSKGGLVSDDRRSLLGNPSQLSSIVVSDKMNISNSINQLKKTASSLCRGKYVYDDTNWTTAAAGGVVCIGRASDDFSEVDPVMIDLGSVADYDGKTIIVYGKNVVLSHSMPASSSYALNLFVDRGNVSLYYDPTEHSVGFDKDGNLGGSISGNFLRGNIFINGLLFGDGGNPVEHKVYVHGKFASLNTGLEPAQVRKDQMQALFTNAVSSFGSLLVTNYCAGNNCINFNNTFMWECQLSGLGSDGNSCSQQGDRFKYNPFVVIDNEIPSVLTQ